MGSLVFKYMGFWGSFCGLCRSWLHSWVGSLRRLDLHFWSKASDLFRFSNAWFGMEVILPSNVIYSFVLMLIATWLFVFGNLHLSLHTYQLSWFICLHLAQVLFWLESHLYWRIVLEKKGHESKPVVFFPQLAVTRRLADWWQAANQPSFS